MCWPPHLIRQADEIPSRFRDEIPQVRELKIGLPPLPGTYSSGAVRSFTGSFLQSPCFTSSRASGRWRISGKGGAAVWAATSPFPKARTLPTVSLAKTPWSWQFLRYPGRRGNTLFWAADHTLLQFTSALLRG